MVTKKKTSKKSKSPKRSPVAFEGLEPLKFNVMPLDAFIMTVHPMWYRKDEKYRLVDRTVCHGTIEWFRIPEHLETIYLSFNNRDDGWAFDGEYIGTKEAISVLREMERVYRESEQAVRSSESRLDNVFHFMERHISSDHYAKICGCD